MRKIFSGRPAKPRFTPDDAANTRLRDTVIFEAERGPNFAGHYRLVISTCGTGCSQTSIVDSVTGKLYRNMPFEMLVRTRLDGHIEPYSFQLHSRLLVAQGYFDSEFPTDTSECSRRYYEWIGSSFKLRRKTLVKCAPPL